CQRLQDSFRFTEHRQGCSPLLRRQVKGRVKQQSVGQIVLRELVLGIRLRQFTGDGQCFSVVFTCSRGVPEIEIKRATESSREMHKSNPPQRALRYASRIALEASPTKINGTAICVRGLSHLSPPVPEDGAFAIGFCEFQSDRWIFRKRAAYLFKGLD